MIFVPGLAATDYTLFAQAAADTGLVVAIISSQACSFTCCADKVASIMRPMVWYGMVWYGMVWYGMAWHGCLYGSNNHGMEWHGIEWHGMEWHGMVCY